MGTETGILSLPSKRGWNAAKHMEQAYVWNSGYLRGHLLALCCLTVLGTASAAQPVKGEVVGGSDCLENKASHQDQQR